METKSFSPTWHPSVAENYFNLYNNVNKTNNILYYDTTTTFINFPKKFTYNRINSNYDLKLYNVVTNTASDNPTFSPILPQTQGTFTINKIAPDSGAQSPTIDLYFQGTIKYEMSWDTDYPEGVYYGNYNATINPNTFPSTSTISINYAYTDRHVEEDYQYSGDTVVISCNWSTTKRTLYTANGTSTLPAPTEALTINRNIVPTIYINNWVGSDYNPPSPSTYIDIDENWYILSYTYIRETPGGTVIDSIPSYSDNVKAHFDKRTSNNEWYHADWINGYRSGWVSETRLTDEP